MVVDMVGGMVVSIEVRFFGHASSQRDFRVALYAILDSGGWSKL
jgi:hypothetical protein